MKLFKKSPELSWRFLIIASCLLVLSCKKKETTPPDLGYDYYPTLVGRYIEYDADSTIYDEITFQPTNYKYRIKEKIEEQFTDSEGKTAFRLVRYIKKYDSTKTYDQTPWAVKDAWQVNAHPNNLEVVEENVRFTKLAFPVKQDAKWNGNVWNTMGEWDYTYSYVDQPEAFGSLSFDKVLMVKQKDFRTLISDQYYVEKYAKGLGLVYREIIDIQYPVTPMSTAVPDIPNKQGTIYTLKIVNYGYE